MSKSRSPHIAIIGAGATGLAMIRNLQREKVAITCFEKHEEIGGLWRYQDSADFPLDIRKHRVRPVNALYQGLRTNLVYPLMMFPDRKIYPRELGRLETRMYPGHEVVQRYLEKYAQTFALDQFIKTGCEVIEVLHKQGKWQVSWKDGNNRTDSGTFDGVVVCNGHNHKPTIPAKPDLSRFKGIVTHSLYYRRPELFKDKNVVLLGAGNSGEDISLELSSHARRIYLCAKRDVKHTLAPGRSKPYGSRCNISQHPGINSCSTDSVTLIDNTSLNNIDVIMLTTGFDYELPFFPDLDKLGLILGDRYLSPLYMDTFCPRLPSLAFMGVPSYVIIFQLAWYQSVWISRVFSGRCALPSSSAMLRAWQWQEQVWKNQGYAERHLQRYLDRQYEVMARIAVLAGVRPMKPILKQYIEAGFQHRMDYPDDYRDKPYPLDVSVDQLF